MTTATNRPAVILPGAAPPSRGRSLRLTAAVVMSVVTHVALLGLFVLFLSATSQANHDREPALMERVDVSADAPEEETRLGQFLHTELGTGQEREAVNANESKILGELTVPGEDDPRRKAGLEGGMLENSLESVPLPPGFSANGANIGGISSSKEGNVALKGDGKGIYTNLLRPNGFPDLAKIRAGGSGSTKEMLLIKHGGGPETEVAVVRGLNWLVRQQSPDGRWMLDGAFKDKGVANDIAGTALGLLPFLGAGKTHRAGKDNPYDKPVEKALMYLRRKQDPKTGNFGGGMYGHGMATIALCESYGLTQDPLLRRNAQMAVNYIVASQHDGGGWRYSPGEAGDLSVSGWQIMALKSAQMAGLDVPAVTFRKAERFLDHCCDKANEGYGYTGAGSTPTLSSVGLLCRQYLQGWGPRNLRLINGIANNVAIAPDAKKDVYYTYYATQVLFHFGGETWTNWNTKMRRTLLDTQENVQTSPNFGSWTATGDVWGSQGGGRLMVTALNLLTLEVYYRHLPLYQREAAAKNDSALK
jgi:hypothetical protein